MTGCAVESLEVLINRCATKWLSFVILKLLTPLQKSLLRKIEKSQRKTNKVKKIICYSTKLAYEISCYLLIQIYYYIYYYI